MSISGVNKYSFAEVNTVDKLSPADTTINKRTLKQQIEKIIKRIIDVCGGLVGVITLIPLTIIIYIANIIAKDKGPVFYSQQRIGKDGKIFKMYKYRSMCIDADEKLKELLENDEEARREYTEYKKLKNDPRVTKIGNFIRKTSLDEFPQFINVIKGQMSLVGPRPYLSTEREDLGKYYPIIIKMKPGLTGPWQVSGRSNLKFKDRIALDIKYYEKRSFWKDMKMVLLTVKKVILREGAM